eukprot:scaffold42929_cov69-Phaeocystis_antarctica.AAC.7
MKLLLDANREAATAVAQARRRARDKTHAAATALRGAAQRAPSLPCCLVLSMPRCAQRFAGREATSALCCRQGRAARCDKAAARRQQSGRRHSR